MGKSEMHVVMLVQLMDYEDDICGFIHKWVNSLARKVDVLDVLTLRTGKFDVPDNVKLHVLKPQGHENRWSATFRFYRALLSIARQSPVDVIFSHMTPVYTIVAAPIAKLWRIPLVTWYTHETISLPLRVAETFSDAILTASKESFSLKSNKLIVTNHGIDTTIFRPAPQSQTANAGHLTISSIGRIVPRKDYETLIRAADLLVHTKGMSHLRFVIIGKEGRPEQRPYFDRMRHLVKELDLEAFVEFAGSISHKDIVPYYHQSDIFVNMRQTGGMDKAVLEAMACEVPAVVCNTTFTPLFGQWADHLLFPENHPQDLADRLEYLIHLAPEQRRAIGKDLRERVVREHDLEQLMDRIVSIFHSL